MANPQENDVVITSREVKSNNTLSPTTQRMIQQFNSAIPNITSTQLLYGNIPQLYPTYSQPQTQPRLVSQPRVQNKPVFNLNNLFMPPASASELTFNQVTGSWTPAEQQQGIAGNQPPIGVNQVPTVSDSAIQNVPVTEKAEIPQIEPVQIPQSPSDELYTGKVVKTVDTEGNEVLPLQEEMVEIPVLEDDTQEVSQDIIKQQPEQKEDLPRQAILGRLNQNLNEFVRMAGDTNSFNPNPNVQIPISDAVRHLLKPNLSNTVTKNPVNTGNFLIDRLINVDLARQNINPNATQLATGALSAIPAALQYTQGVNHIVNLGARVDDDRQLMTAIANDPSASYALRINTLLGNALQNEIRKTQKEGLGSLRRWGNYLSNYFDYSAINPKDLGEFLKNPTVQNAEKWARGAEKRFVQNPVDNILDASMVGGIVGNTFKSLTKVQKAATIGDAINQMPRNQKVQTYFNLSNAVAVEEISDFEMTLDRLRGINSSAIDKAIESAETGKVLSDNYAKTAKKILEKISEEYHKIAERKGAAVNPQVMAVAQRLTRIFKIPYYEARKIVEDFIDTAGAVKPATITKTFDKYYFDTMEQVTGMTREQIVKSIPKPQKVSKEILPDGSVQLGGYRMSTGEIFASDASALFHEYVHHLTKTLVEQAKNGNTVALDKIQKIENVIGRKINLDLFEVDGNLGESIAYAMQLFKDGTKPYKWFNSPQTQDLAQKFWRTELEEVNPNKFNITKEGEDILNNLGEYGKEIKQGFKLYDEKDIFPVPHAAKEVTGGSTAGIIEAENRKYLGAFTDRILGTQTYKEVREALLNNKFIDDTYKDLLKKTQVDNLTGSAGELEAGAKNAIYIDKEGLKNIKNLSELPKVVLEQVPASEIDKYLVKDKSFIEGLINGYDLSNNFGNPYKSGSGLDALYRIQRSNMLGTGGYLAGNLGTAGINTLINSNINLARDISSAMQTEGRLAKVAGLKRRIRLPEVQRNNKLAEFVERANRPLSSVFQYIDAKAQNLATEIALNNSLANKGVPVGQRVNYIKDTDKLELARLIQDAQDVSALNTTFSLVPKQARGFVASVNPFYRWQDTALRSTISMWRKHPVISNMVWHNALGRISYDREMQDRLAVGADLDIPFSHMVFNPKSGKYAGVTMDFAPQTSTMKAGVNLAKALTTGDIKPLLGSSQGINPIAYSMFGVFKGVDNRGNLIYRDKTLTGKDVYNDYKTKQRFTVDEKGNLAPLGTQADEVLNAAITNFFVYPKFLDRTVPSFVQAGADLAGYNLNYYKPNASSPIGSFNPNFIGADPSRISPSNEALYRALGMYISPAQYRYPLYSGDIPTGRERRSIIRSRNRRVNRNQSRIRQNLGQ